jgi:hypothetical protein
LGGAINKDAPTQVIDISSDDETVTKQLSARASSMNPLNRVVSSVTSGIQNIRVEDIPEVDPLHETNPTTTLPSVTTTEVSPDKTRSSPVQKSTTNLSVNLDITSPPTDSAQEQHINYIDVPLECEADNTTSLPSFDELDLIIPESPGVNSALLPQAGDSETQKTSQSQSPHSSLSPSSLVKHIFDIDIPASPASFASNPVDKDMRSKRDSPNVESSRSTSPPLFMSTPEVSSRLPSVSLCV